MNRGITGKPRDVRVTRRRRREKACQSARASHVVSATIPPITSETRVRKSSDIQEKKTFPVALRAPATANSSPQSEVRAMKRSNLSAVRPIGRQAFARSVEDAAPRIKISVMLQKKHVAYLDRVRVAIRLQHRKIISRGDVISGFIAFMMESGIDFSEFASERAMTQFFTRYFGAQIHQQEPEVAATG